MLGTLKANFDGDFWAALEAFKIIGSSTSLALIEWALEHPTPTEVYLVQYSDYDGGSGVSVHRTEAGAQAAIDGIDKRDQPWHYIDRMEVQA